MTTMSATKASRNFSALLDAVERGDSVTITRGNRPVAQVSPARRRTGRDLRRALAELPPLDDEFERDIESARTFVSAAWQDPWSDS